MTIITRNRTYSTPPPPPPPPRRKRKSVTVDTSRHEQNVEVEVAAAVVRDEPRFLTADKCKLDDVLKEKGRQSKVGQEEEQEQVAVAVAIKEPRFLTADKCKPDDVLMHCPWMCNWVKPVPDTLRHYIQTSPNTNYVDYLKESNRPDRLFKQTNAYKRTVAHIWKCGRKHNKNRSDWPSYFDRTWKGKDLKTTKMDTATMAGMTSPAHRKKDRGNETPRHMTVEKCNAGAVVMECPNPQCHFVKVLPKELVRYVPTAVKGGILIVVTDEEAATAVRKTSQWKRMRLHTLACCAKNSIPAFLKERGTM
jgi:hypothetical protein